MDSQIGQWIIIGIAVAFIAFDKAKKLFAKNGDIEKKVKDLVESIARNGKNGGNSHVLYKYNPHPPGFSETCQRHGERLASIESEIGAIKEDIREIRKKVFNGMK